MQSFFVNKCLAAPYSSKNAKRAKGFLGILIQTYYILNCLFIKSSISLERAISCLAEMLQSKGIRILVSRLCSSHNYPFFTATPGGWNIWPILEGEAALSFPTIGPVLWFMYTVQVTETVWEDKTELLSNLSFAYQEADENNHYQGLMSET